MDLDNKKLPHPVPGKVYKLSEMLTNMYLRDSPHLNFRHEGQKLVIQDSHLTETEMLAIPGMADSLWKYMYETDEWIPVFDYVGKRPITEMVMFVDNTDDFLEDKYIVYPIGTYPYKD